MSASDQLPARARWRTPAAWIPTLVALVGIALAAYPLTLPNMLAGVHGYGNGQGYDDGAYLGMVIHLVHGSLPYRDYGFVQPPGIALVLSPVAALDSWIGTRDVLVICRLATVLVAGLNCALVALAVRHRGWVASASAGLLLAAFPGAYTADHTLLLEPWLVLFCLLAFVLAFPGGRVATTRRRLLLAGLCAGFAGTVKVWAVLPILPLVVVVIAVRRKQSAALLLGVFLGAVVPSLPFFLAAPRAFLHDVLAAQLARSTSGARVDAAARLGVLSGLKHFGEPASTLPVIGIAVVVALVVVAALGLARRQLLAAEVTAAMAAGLIVLGLFVPVQFYDHYAYFSAAFVALLIGAILGLLAAAVPRLAHARLATPWNARVAAGASPVLVVGVLVAVVLSLPQGIGRSRSFFAEASDPGLAVSQLVPKGACVISDDPVLLIVANRYVSSRPRCPLVVDPFGLWVSDADGSLPHLGGPFPEPFVDEWSGWLDQADYVVLSVPGSSYLPFSPGLIEQFGNQYRQVGSVDHAYVYQRIPRV